MSPGVGTRGTFFRSPGVTRGTVFRCGSTVFQQILASALFRLCVEMKRFRIRRRCSGVCPNEIRNDWISSGPWRETDLSLYGPDTSRMYLETRAKEQPVVPPSTHASWKMVACNSYGIVSITRVNIEVFAGESWDKVMVRMEPVNRRLSLLPS